jgi:hypothetical protein
LCWIPERVGKVVIGLCVHPPVSFGEILQSSDKICGGNGILAFGAKEFRNFVLLDPEVEIGGPIVASSSCCGNCSLGSGVAGAIIVPVEVDIAIVMVVVVVIVFWGQVDIVTSGSGHFAAQSFKISYLNSCGFSDPCCGL